MLRAETPPNIVLLFADDMGVGDVSCYYAEDFETPRIDSMAANGVKFEAGYVTAPICGPSRAGLLAGRYQQRFGFETNPSPPYRAWEERLGLPAEVEILPEVMKRSGYATGVVGKWHIGLRPEFRPERRGVDYFWGLPAGMHSYVQTHDFWYNWGNAIEENGRPDDDWEYLTDDIAERAVGFIERHRDKPFFLYVPFNAPHGPLQATPEYLERVPDTVGEDRRVYAAMVLALDDAVGSILDALERSGLLERTLVVFTTDNGVHRNLKSPHSPLNGAKGRVEEGGVRVPFLVQWPGTIPAGRVLPGPVCTFDLYATAAALAGAEDIQPIDGVDLMPYLTGETSQPPHEILCWRGFTRSGIRQGEWKLIREDDQPAALYNLESDLGESDNLADARPEVVERLEMAYREWESGMQAPAWGNPQREHYAEQRRLWEGKIDFRNVPPGQRANLSGEVEPYFRKGEKAPGITLEDMVYKTTPQGELQLRVYKAEEGAERRPAAVFFFGGGWKNGAIIQFGKHCEFLASHGYVAITPQYRTLSQHGTTPKEAVMDAKSCIRWIRANADTLGIDPDRLLVGGGSAGGHLAAATAAITAINDPNDDLSISPVPNALVLFNPVVDNGPGEDAYGHDRVAEYWRDFSPIHNIEGKSMPPTAVFLGTSDRLIPVSVGERFVELVRQTGAPAELFLYEEQGHGFFNYREGDNPFFHESLLDMAQFLKESAGFPMEPMLR